jgi:hypothetical protein
VIVVKIKKAAIRKLCLIESKKWDVTIKRLLHKVLHANDAIRELKILSISSQKILKVIMFVHHQIKKFKTKLLRILKYRILKMKYLMKL